MRHHILQRIAATATAAILTVGALFLQPALTAEAAGATTATATAAATTTTAATAPTYRHWDSDIYYLVGSTAGSETGAYLAGVGILDDYYKEIGTLAGFELLTAQHTNGTYSMAFRQSTISTIQSIHAQCQTWCAGAMPVIVPQGTSMQNALTLTARWIADYMTYDNTATTNMALANSYQNALIGLSTGKGVCATYSTMFDTMVSYLPINPQNGTVDYTCAAPTHLETRYISNNSHGYSAVNLNGTWYIYDVTNYDNMNGTRQPQYLHIPMTTVAQ